MDTSELDWLADPVAADDPCGPRLDGTAQFEQFGALRLFGRCSLLHDEPDWRSLCERSLYSLTLSRDLRILPHLIAATLRTGTLIEVLPLFGLSRAWLARYWDEIHPQLGGDAIERRDALNLLADRVAILDRLHRMLCELQFTAGLNSLDAASVRLICFRTRKAMEAPRETRKIMWQQGGEAAVPQFDPLFAQLAHILQVMDSLV